jgi:hypothetical protein
MGCHRCDTLMEQVDLYTDARVLQAWYHCPVCDGNSMQTQRFEGPLARLGDRQRCVGRRLETDSPTS